jgi:hypothetical protein
VILSADGIWQTGGTWRAWIAPASREKPHELREIAEDKDCIYPADPDAWQNAKANAVKKLCALQGLPVQPDFAE